MMNPQENSPPRIRDAAHLEDLLSAPTDRVIETVRQTEGDFLVLGAAGKMGPSLSRMLRRALDAAGQKSRRVIAVSRFSSPAAEPEFNLHGVETLRADLLDPAQLAALPDAPNVVYMAGMKFGATGQAGLTWAMNAYLPGRVADKYRRSRIVAFSTGNIYGLSPVHLGGSVETDEPQPTGEYAMSAVGRERMFEHFSTVHGTRAAIIRLNYAVEMRYGVLHDIAAKVWRGQPVDVSMGCVNVIWQGDANAMSLCALADASTPPMILNVAGPETLSVRRIAETFARLFDKPATIVGQETTTALLNNGQLAHRLYGYPRVPVAQILRWTADWISTGGAALNKPTHFEARDGKF